MKKELDKFKMPVKEQYCAFGRHKSVRVVLLSLVMSRETIFRVMIRPGVMDLCIEDCQDSAVAGRLVMTEDTEGCEGQMSFKEEADARAVFDKIKQAGTMSRVDLYDLGFRFSY
jgi:hypothetical protein